MIVRSVLLFVLAGLAEIGGGYLMWLWLREGRPWWVRLVGALVVVLYGIIPTFQPSGLDFGKVYAAYGGAFIGLSLLWGWMVDGCGQMGQAQWEQPSRWWALRLLSTGRACNQRLVWRRA